MRENLTEGPAGRSAPHQTGYGAWLSGLSARWGYVTLGVASLLAALVTLDPQADPDLFARLAVGRLVEVGGGVTDQDPFAFTPLRERWIDHEWLSGVVFWRAASLGGDLGLLGLNLLAMLAMVALVVRAQHERSGASLGWSLLTLLHVFVAWSSVVRSRAFTLVFTAVLLLVLVRWRNGRAGWLWLLPACFLVWANAHGGFVAGLGLLGAAATAVTLRTPRRSLPLWVCLAACFAVTFINPYGAAYWRYILDATGMERPMILEWQPMQGWQIALVVLLGSVYALGAWLGRSSRKVLPETVGLLAVSLWAAIDSQRLLNFLLLVLAVYGAAEYRTVIRTVAASVPKAYRAAASHLAGVVALAAPVVLLAITGVQLGRVTSTGLGYDQYPMGAFEWLERQGQGGRLLTHFNHGSLAIWRLYPLYRVAVDGRYEETYPEETVQLAWRALQPNVPGHDEALAEVDPDYILVPGADWAADFRGDWVTVYADSVSAVLARPDLVSTADRPPRPMWRPGF